MLMDLKCKTAGMTIDSMENNDNESHTKESESYYGINNLVCFILVNVLIIRG